MFSKIFREKSLIFSKITSIYVQDKIESVWTQIILIEFKHLAFQF